MSLGSINLKACGRSDEMQGEIQAEESDNQQEQREDTTIEAIGISQVTEYEI